MSMNQDSVTLLSINERVCLITKIQPSYTPQTEQVTGSPQNKQSPVKTVVGQTVGSEPTSVVTPAVSPTWLFSLF